MMWNPLQAIKNKLKRPARAAPPESPAAAPPIVGAARRERSTAAGQFPAPPAKEETPQGLEDLEKKGLLSKFFRHWKDPAFLRQVKNMAARMQAEGVNIKDRKAVQEWVLAHKADIEAGKFAEAGTAEVRTFVKSGPDLGRNDPCSCGSGRKFKKCCGKQ